MQILDDGRVTDSQGRTVDFKNTILIMTSNIGSSYLLDGIDSEGNISEEARQNTMNDLKGHFRPEFLNRIDEIVSFKSLTNTELLQIVDLMLQNTNKALQDKDIIMNISDSAKNFLLEKGTDLKYGARPLRRAIQRYVEDELSDLILKSDLKNGQTVNIDCINNELSFVVE